MCFTSLLITQKVMIGKGIQKLSSKAATSFLLPAHLLYIHPETPPEKGWGLRATI
jgi:hypothetical protein